MGLVGLTGALAHGKIPARVRCVNAECLESFPGYCAAGAGGTVALEGESAETRLRAGKLRVDYSEGEQRSFYTFSVKDLEALSGRKRIGGEYEEGLERAGEYHVRARIRLECGLD
jgi:hypothetical protein